jgi:DNA invertase Pin-like site-specific DNA recombinase
VNNIREKPTKIEVAVIYIRTATADLRGSRLGVERQRLVCEEYALRLGLHITDTYVDVGVSGLRESRPALDQLMLDLSRGHIRHVVIADPARLARSRELAQRLHEHIRSEGASLTTPCDALRQEPHSN